MPIDWLALLASVDGDIEVVRELVELFDTSGRSNLQIIADALQRADMRAVGAQAHQLKGASANLHAPSVTLAAERLETAVSNDNGIQLQELARDLHSEFTRAIEFLAIQVAFDTNRTDSL